MWIRDLALWLTEPRFAEQRGLIPQTPEDDVKDKQERLDRAGGAALMGGVAFAVGTLLTGGIGAGVVAGGFLFAVGLKEPMDPATRAAILEQDRADAEYRRRDIIHEGDP